MQMRKIDIRDVQFLVKEDGSFVVADPRGGAYGIRAVVGSAWA